MHPKVSAGVFAGALVTVVLGLVAAFGVDWKPDPAWVAALTTIVALAAGWAMPSRLSQPSDDAELIDQLPAEPTDAPAAGVR